MNAEVSHVSSLLDDAEHRRLRAQESRRIAAEISDSEVRVTILNAAQEYDRLAVGAALRQHAKRQGSAVV
jgi:hypothetical protein